ncbi:HAD-IA family hydrolase [Candidatus Gracilibacteria bacterium]|nr:HAD-IA family hydrolase [Candidatus Gracilibacteria bacterium]NUJ98474.1 HAD-IA family hydrolase [Candidatus Gracilibacteria bacterium]
MAIKCILFDADGVVIRNSEIFSTQYEKKYNLPSGEMLPFFEGEFQNCIIGKADLKEILQIWLPKWNWEKTTDEFLEFWFEMGNNPDEKMLEIVKKLRKKGIKCCIATNQEKYRTQFMRKNMKFGELFDFVFSSAEIAYKKPEKEFYEFILNYLNKKGIEAEETLFFDDSEKNINEAKKVGINGFFYKNFEEFEEVVKDFL